MGRRCSEGSRRCVSPEAAGGRERLRRGWGSALVAAGCLLCILSALFLPWARVAVTWKSILFNTDVDLGIYTFKLTENAWLTAALVAVACLGLAGLAWRRRSGTVALAVSLLLLAGCIAYLVSLLREALDFLGLYERLLELVRALPLIGQAAEELVRERLAVRALPHAGGFVFAAGVALVLAGGLLLRLRGVHGKTAALDGGGDV
ncbi:MAG: hypothetical protein QME88_06930 [Actinomycetota bacterium]|nr:hypothetical protein [Actinomycetota bacterium]